MSGVAGGHPLQLPSQSLPPGRVPALVVDHDPKRRRVFSKDLVKMMYGFGDSDKPLAETVDVVEDLVCDFMTNLTESGMALARRKGKKLETENIVVLVRKHPKMYFRAKELLRMNKEISEAKKASADLEQIAKKTQP
ncbi:transcription initiation factor IID, 18kD subunit-domain-containing protein [Baffinella frigidus]|nr:transcription initiation factor IID, 18kD subunit-domain-containing protein [Cryptophyta sp. CCMP2293]|eukprot:CAMPEP_0180159226 /NCGR_PEP_ID=MMETSP0986-20121125/27397_1 /TAXON_ID=697907 /ORGANISM="non described non described, Strain CCMP2293" /LENGTH=136 /DNA_ID=CAMNT_0022109269 /DNA_START=9 /DNA_END=419 /DNA_ORIENTATION=+